MHQPRQLLLPRRQLPVQELQTAQARGRGVTPADALLTHLQKLLDFLKGKFINEPVSPAPFLKEY